VSNALSAFQTGRGMRDAGLTLPFRYNAICYFTNKKFNYFEL